MWSPIILLCLLTNLTECITIGGPVELSKDLCEKSIVEVGLPLLRKKYSDKVIEGYGCMRWNRKKSHKVSSWYIT